MTVALLSQSAGAFSSVAAFPNAQQRLRTGIALLPSRRRIGQCVQPLPAFPIHRTQYGIYHAAGAGLSHPFGERHHFVDRGRSRDLIHGDQLVRPHPQNIQHGGMESLDIHLTKAGDQIVQRELALDHSVKQGSCQCFILLWQCTFLQFFLQQNVGIALIAVKTRQRFHRPATGIIGHQSFLRPRPITISNNRKNCMSDTSSAAT